MEEEALRKKGKTPASNIIARIIICILIIGIGVVGQSKLANLKKPPTETTIEERPLKVNVLSITPENIPVSITGYGEVRVLNEVTLSPEVSGTITDIHLKLEPGEIVAENDILFKIDTRNYKSARDEARAQVSQWNNAISRFEKQYRLDRERLKTIERNRDLAENEYQRVRRLFEKNKVGTRSGVDKSEQAFNAAVDNADQLSRAISLYPIQIKEAQSSLASAMARLALAEANLNRCVVRAPFTGRVKKVALEKGQYVSPGAGVITLADDSTLEIHVPLDSRDARKWLQFERSSRNASPQAWFSGLKQVPCTIMWTEAPGDHAWKGTLHRAVQFDQQTRTLTVAVRINAADILSGNGRSLPLVEGMFCSVSIPGATMSDVFRVPRWAVSFNNTVYVVLDSRLKTVPVEVARSEGDYAFIEKGLSPQDLVVTTRLVDPLENSLLEIIDTQDKGDRS